MWKICALISVFAKENDKESDNISSIEITYLIYKVHMICVHVDYICRTNEQCDINWF